MDSLFEETHVIGGGRSLASFGDLDTDHEIITVQCCQCGKDMEIERGLYEIYKNATCDECSEKWEQQQILDRFKSAWNEVCPPSSIFNKTDPEHKDFPREHFRSMLTAYKANDKQSFYIYGGNCKTRLMMYFMKWLIGQYKSAMALMAEDLQDMAYSRNKRSMIRDLCQTHYLGIDDALKTALRDKKSMETLHMILDARKRQNLPIVFSGDLIHETYVKGEGEYGDMAQWQVDQAKSIHYKLDRYCMGIHTGRMLRPTNNGMF